MKEAVKEQQTLTVGNTIILSWKLCLVIVICTFCTSLSFPALLHLITTPYPVDLQIRLNSRISNTDEVQCVWHHGRGATHIALHLYY